MGASATLLLRSSLVSRGASKASQAASDDSALKEVTKSPVVSLANGMPLAAPRMAGSEAAMAAQEAPVAPHIVWLVVSVGLGHERISSIAVLYLCAALAYPYVRRCIDMAKERLRCF